MRFLAAALCTTFAIFTLTPPSTGTVAARAPQRFEVVARRFEFAPSDITVKKGEPVILALSSQDVDHGLKFKDLDVNVMVKKGQTREVTFTPSQAGTFVGQCSIFCGSGHGGMKLTMHVTE